MEPRRRNKPGKAGSIIHQLRFLLYLPPFEAEAESCWLLFNPQEELKIVNFDFYCNGFQAFYDHLEKSIFFTQDTYFIVMMMQSEALHNEVQHFLTSHLKSQSLAIQQDFIETSLIKMLE